MWPDGVCLTLVQVCEGLIVQLDGGRRGSAQHILEWGVFGLAFRRKAGFLLLEDRQSQHVADGERERPDGGQEAHKVNTRMGRKTHAELQTLY